MPRRTNRPMTSKVTEAELLDIERRCKRRKDRPDALSFRSIHVAEKVFNGETAMRTSQRVTTTYGNSFVS